MMQILEDGHLFTQEDSSQYVEYKLKEAYCSFSEFDRDKDILDSGYWGDCFLNGIESDYKRWIVQIAKKILK